MRRRSRQRSTPAALRECRLTEPGYDEDGRGRLCVICRPCHVPGAALLADVGAVWTGAGRLNFALVSVPVFLIKLAHPQEYLHEDQAFRVQPQ